MEEIQFICLDKEYYDVYDPPIPAGSVLPEWHKASLPYANDKKEFIGGVVNGTAKSCSGVIDAMRSGYLFTAPCDLWFNLNDAGGHTITWKSGIFPHINAFSPDQTMHTGLDKELWSDLVYKLNTQWVTRTPMGVSTMIQHPWWRDNVPFSTLPGVVDTDVYNAPTNIIFVIRRDFEGMIPCGTPMAQIIPFRREEWQHSVRLDDGSVSLLKARDDRFIENHYKREQRAKKVFE